MIGGRELVLYGRPGCHLCDEAREILVSLLAQAPDLAFSEVNIESDDDLLRTYLERIPVITVDGSVISELVPDPGSISAILLHTSA